MAEDNPASRESGHRVAVFATTHWSVVLQAGAEFSPGAQEALENLCRGYWYPLYVHVRRLGWGPEDAQDLTQQFFGRLLERKYLERADPERGRFRSFLLTSLKHFLTDEWEKLRTQKRGGGRQILSLDDEMIETRLLAEPADERSPDKEFDRRWAAVLLERALDQLQSEFAAVKRGHTFEALKSSLTGEESGSSYAEIGWRLGMTEGNLKVTVHRLRRRYRELLREEISRTVEDPAAIDAEMRDLFAALSS